MLRFLGFAFLLTAALIIASPRESVAQLHDPGTCDDNDGGSSGGNTPCKQCTSKRSQFGTLYGCCSTGFQCTLAILGGYTVHSAKGASCDTTGTNCRVVGTCTSSLVEGPVDREAAEEGLGYYGRSVLAAGLSVQKP